MNKSLPFHFKILIGINSFISLSALLMLWFYVFNNVVSDNGMAVGPLKVLYSITFLMGIIMILLLLFTKKIAVIFELLYGLMTIISGLRGNMLQIIIGIIILFLVLNKSILTYCGFIKYQNKKVNR